MKRVSACSAIIVLGLVSCETMKRPITSGDFDPLRPPGSQSDSAPTVSTAFKAGQFVRAAMDNTAFFKARPKGDADADKLLKRGTSMKVISGSDSYVKVELDSGEVGFVPSVMLEDPSAMGSGGNGGPGEFQVYPPTNGFGEPLPQINPADQPPEGAIPTVIDPEAPAATEPLPPVEPLDSTFPAPAEPEKKPAPLPPNGEDDETAE